MIKRKIPLIIQKTLAVIAKRANVLNYIVSVWLRGTTVLLTANVRNV
jgi:hypothetical protein